MGALLPHPRFHLLKQTGDGAGLITKCELALTFCALQDDGNFIAIYGGHRRLQEQL